MVIKALADLLHCVFSLMIKRFQLEEAVDRGIEDFRNFQRQYGGGSVFPSFYGINALTRHTYQTGKLLLRDLFSFTFVSKSVLHWSTNRIPEISTKQAGF